MKYCLYLLLLFILRFHNKVHFELNKILYNTTLSKKYDMKHIIYFFFLSFFLNISPLFSQTNCNEQDILEIDRIKQEIETSLISATTSEIRLRTGEKLFVFYLDGKLIKMSVNDDANSVNAQLFFKDDFIRHISEDIPDIDNIASNRYYFKNNKLICFQDSMGKDYNNSELYKEAEKLWLERIDKYLLAIQ